MGFFIALCFHFVLHRYVSIYPSLVFPAFSDAPKIVDEVKFPDVQLYALTNKDHSIKLSKETFFSNLYADHANFFLKTISKRESGYNKSALLRQRRSAFISYAIGQLRKIYPNQDFIGLELIKANRYYSVKKGHLIPPVIANQNRTVIYFNNEN
ncbi:hypothetical protein ADIARSV_0642 [Arcticibacter svalbardensis MN12-7]|uniref:Uncharacterized protein n=1 Tax=Arcticibacter svalbardensis MN12-7 TaxID=1150600 RepID=R9H4P0_9SPHI|nr:hypothetical protein ADIARSV_0642 [Arcticibacter svalbardensis MN12-7]